MQKFLQMILLACFVALVGCVTGCQTYSERVADYRAAFAVGDMERASRMATEMVEDYAEEDDDRDALLAVLELANTARVKGDLKRSYAAFARAERIYEVWQRKARVSLSREGFSLLTNPTTLPYRGAGADILMVNVYQTLNAFAMADFAGARQPLMRLDVHQKEVVEENAERIAKSRDAVAKSSNANQINQTSSSDAVQNATQSLMKDLPDTRGYELYTNPFAEFLFAFYHLYLGVDSADYEMARFRMGRALAMAPENTALRQEVERLNADAPLKPTVYLFHETGLAPYRKEFAITLPIYAGGTLSWVSIALPSLKSDANAAPFATLCGGGQRATAEMVCDMDAVVTQEYKNDYPGILTRAIASATAKAAASYAMNYAAKQSGDGLVQLVALIGTAAYQIGSNAADTRSWQTLPKYIGISRIDLPEDRVVTLNVKGESHKLPISAEGSVYVVYLRTMHSHGKSHIRVIRIR
jgi:hypothetical protein